MKNFGHLECLQGVKYSTKNNKWNTKNHKSAFLSIFNVEGVKDVGDVGDARDLEDVWTVEDIKDVKGVDVEGWRRYEGYEKCGNVIKRICRPSCRCSWARPLSPGAGWRYTSRYPAPCKLSWQFAWSPGKHLILSQTKKMIKK